MTMTGDGDPAGQITYLRRFFAETVAYARSREDLFPRSAPQMSIPPRAAKEEIWGIWQRVLDLVLGLDRLADAYARWPWRRNRLAREHDLTHFAAAYLAQCRYVLDFIALAERWPVLDAVLNDRVPEMGLAPGNYDALKLRFLNAARGTEFALLAGAFATLSTRAAPQLQQSTAEDSAALWAKGVHEGPVLTARNVLSVMRKAALQSWFPVQKRASLTLSHLRLPVREGWHIAPRQALSLVRRLEPGDILLERREWAFTNLGLPGFWTHAALYIGTPEEREAFASSPDVRRWVRAEGGADGQFEEALAAWCPASYEQACGESSEGSRVRVVEALGQGVLLTSLEGSAACDGLAVLRPRVPPASRAAAIARALRFVGRPYDFAFNFASDSAMVCSELVLKVYEPRNGLAGLRLPLREIAGHRVVPANEFARTFDAEAGRRDAQFALVLFLDGDERRGRAVEADEAAFRASWRRPKWHVLSQQGWGQVACKGGGQLR
jgi:hypothetical protein